MAPEQPLTGSTDIASFSNLYNKLAVLEQLVSKLCPNERAEEVGNVVGVSSEGNSELYTYVSSAAAINFPFILSQHSVILTIGFLHRSRWIGMQCSFFKAKVTARASLSLERS